MSQCSFLKKLFKPGKDTLEIRYSKKLKNSWRVVLSKGKRTLTLPAFFQSAPEEIKEALEAWALLPHFRPGKQKKEVLRFKRELEIKIRSFSTEYACPQNKRSKDPSIYENNTQGVIYNLRDVFDTINKNHFDNQLKSYVRWGKVNSKTSYQTTRSDHLGKSYNLITIAGIYNSKTVPEFVINGIMYHEMLHIKIPPYIKNGRRVVHGKEFRDAEKNMPMYNEWTEWEKNNMHKLFMDTRRGTFF
ncbi:hypothetical protein CHISP_1940 [Chitinispirillum alkaliphilum]|nr:hypothetical protein CHISP_1940 [Chitinispirillum alkaliphilum]